MQVGLATNLAGWGLTIAAAFAISTDYNILRAISFSEGDVTGENVASGASIQGVAIDIGLRAVAVDNPHTSFRGVVDFDQFCSGVGAGLERYLKPEDCNACNDSSQSLVASLITSCVLYIPTVSTNILRMYPNYDVNCQKTFGTLITALSMCLSLYSFLGYRNKCFNSFYEGDVYYALDGESYGVVDPEDPAADVVVNFDWNSGIGYQCIMGATILKVIDILCHLLIPTPSITRNRQEQLDYEKLNTAEASFSGETSDNSNPKSKVKPAEESTPPDEN